MAPRAVGEALPAGRIRLGIDENGLGARLGPMLVTAVAAECTDDGLRALSRRPRGRLAEDLDDSKRLLNHENVELGEAWARALTGDLSGSPRELLSRISLEAEASLTEHCPGPAHAQCWSAADLDFEAPGPVVRRIQGHLQRLTVRGVRVLRVRSAIVCTGRLNRALGEGRSRFALDLHAMEALALGLREELGCELTAICGKVGGIRDYPRFFGPLAGYLHTTLEETRRSSAYRFPGLGEICFIQDADATDPLVMMASLVGKYLRELLMSRIQRFYTPDDERRISGYHDPRTRAWVDRIQPRRRALHIVDACFERAKATP